MAYYGLPECRGHVMRQRLQAKLAPCGTNMNADLLSLDDVVYLSLLLSGGPGFFGGNTNAAAGDPSEGQSLSACCYTRLMYIPRCRMCVTSL